MRAETPRQTAPFFGAIHTKSLARFALPLSLTASLLGDVLPTAWAKETVEPGAVRLDGVTPSKHPQGEPKLLGKTGKKAAAPVASAGSPTAPPMSDVAVLCAALHKPGTSDAQQADAIAALVKLDTPPAITALLGELSTGLSPSLSALTLDGLGKHKYTSGDPSPLAAFFQFSKHRSPELRRLAYVGLAALTEPLAATTPGKPGQPAAVPTSTPVQNPQVVRQLVAGLSDSSSEIRAVAAGALGARREKSAEGALIKLLLRKDSAAPPALGLIGGPDTARALAEMVGNVPDRMILETLGELLKRPDFGPEPVRVQVIKTLGKMPGAQTLDILLDYVKLTAPDKNKPDRENKPRPSRIEAQKIIELRTAK